MSCEPESRDRIPPSTRSLAPFAPLLAIRLKSERRFSYTNRIGYIKKEKDKRREREGKKERKQRGKVKRNRRVGKKQQACLFLTSSMRIGFCCSALFSIGAESVSRK